MRHSRAAVGGVFFGAGLSTTLLLAQDGGGGAPVSDVPLGPLLGGVVAIVLLSLLLWGVRQPLAWVIVSFQAIGTGVGLAAYGIGMHQLANSPPLRRGEVEELVILISAGLGSFVAGVVLLGVALARNRKRGAPAGSAPVQAN